MSTSPNFTTVTLAEKFFFADNFKTFSIAATRLNWTSPFGHHTKDGIQLLRYKFDTVNNNYKIVGRVLFPTKVWEFLCGNLGALTLELFQQAGVKIETTIQPPINGL